MTFRPYRMIVVSVPSRARKQAVIAIAALAALTCFDLVAMTMSSQSLLPHHVGGEIRVTAPGLHFLTGKSLTRLRDGAAVPFDFQLSIATGPRASVSKTTVAIRALERFTVSYDVWEEKFSVVRVRDFRRSSMRLSADSAESWCLDNTFVQAASLPAGRRLWARLEIRSVESKELLPGESGINLATLIEIFSRPARPQQDRWSLESAPFQADGPNP